MWVLKGVSAWLLLFAVAACGSGGETIDAMSAVAEGRSRGISSVEVASDGRTVVLEFTGAHPDTGPCSEGYEGWVQPAGDMLEAAVIVTRDQDRGVACNLAGRQREVVVELAEAFTGNEIRDLTSRRVFYLGAPDEVAELTGLPAGWELRAEHDLLFGSWSRTYGPVEQLGGAAPQVELVHALNNPATSTQVVGAFILQFSAAGLEPTMVMVGGIEGLLYEHPGGGDLLLVWQLGNEGLALITRRADFTPEALVALAHGVEVGPDGSSGDEQPGEATNASPPEETVTIGGPSDGTVTPPSGKPLDCESGRWTHGAPETPLGEALSPDEVLDLLPSDLFPGAEPQLDSQSSSQLVWLYITPEGHRVGRLAAEELGSRWYLAWEEGCG